MLNYRDQSDGEDISLFVNSVMLCRINTDMAGEYNTQNRALIGSYQVIEQ